MMSSSILLVDLVVISIVFLWQRTTDSTNQGCDFCNLHSSIKTMVTQRLPVMKTSVRKTWLLMVSVTILGHTQFVYSFTVTNHPSPSISLHPSNNGNQWVMPQKLHPSFILCRLLTQDWKLSKYGQLHAFSIWVGQCEEGENRLLFIVKAKLKVLHSWFKQTTTNLVFCWLGQCRTSSGSVLVCHPMSGKLFL